MSHLVLGTAGHIDHGKSSLVEALTGTDPDRLHEEQVRGITIELGFAELDLGDGLHLSIVDVPGHERFVRHMVAGATGIDAVLLVVAADEGVMPQTREHLQICNLLGVQSGFVALTKSDLADDDLREVVELELLEYLRGSFLDGCPVVPVSARTGQGLDRVREELRRLFSSVTARSGEGIPRLPVDRSFSMHGFGTVVTGTLVSGTFGEGQEVEVLPGGDRGRIRGLQVHGEAVKQAPAGRRTAVNLQGLRCDQVPRGSTLTVPGGLRTTRRIWGRVRLLEGAPESIRKGGIVRFHQGTGEASARLRLKGEPVGGEQDVEIVLDSPAVLVPGDRFILRRPMPVDTLGGGVVTDNNPPRGKAARDEQVDSDPVLLRVARLGFRGARIEDLSSDLGIGAGPLERRLRELDADGVVLSAAGRWFPAALLAGLGREIATALERFHRAQPLKQGVSRERLRTDLCRDMPREAWRAWLGGLEQDGALAVHGELLAVPGHRVKLTPEQEARLQAMESRFRTGGLDPPREDEVLAADGGPDGPDLLELLIGRGRLIRVEEGRPFHAAALEDLTGRLKEFARNSTTIDVAAFKDLAGVTRKNAIPLLEYLDGERRTRRVGNVREILIR